MSFSFVVNHHHQDGEASDHQQALSGFYPSYPHQLLTSGFICDMVRHPKGAIMSIRKRSWTTKQGEAREAWIVDYVDGQGDRHIKTFDRKKDADAYRGQVTVDIGLGVHTAPRKSVTVAEAGALWLETGENNGLERATLDSYRQHLRLHIAPVLGAEKLATLTTATIRSLEDRLRAKGLSPVMRRRVIVSLGSLLADAQERGLVAQNVVRSLRASRKHKGRSGDQRRDKAKLRVGVDIPTPDEIRRIIAHLTGRWRPLLSTAICTGLRASELRGLRWEDIDLKRGKLHVAQRADRYNVIGPLKSASSERTIPLPPSLVSILREWKLQCPKGDLGLAFPNGIGKVENIQNILNRGFFPAQIAAGIVTKGGSAKYTGLHTLRHFFASLCANRKQDGGHELPIKVVQELMGHSTIVLTADRYSHLFPGNDAFDMDRATAALLG
jgi:integrase